MLPTLHHQEQGQMCLGLFREAGKKTIRKKLSSKMSSRTEAEDLLLTKRNPTYVTYSLCTSVSSLENGGNTCLELF